MSRSRELSRGRDVASSMELEGNDIDPFSKLASELLSQVFIHCLPSDTDPISPRTCPLLLLQVCRRWRETAYLTPNLWQVICLGRKFKGDPILILDLFLEKSRNLPLTITLPSPRHPKLTPARNEELVNRVFDNLHRILALKGHVTSSFPYIIYKRLVAAVARGDSRHLHAPLLKSLDIGGFDIPSQLSQQEFTEYLSGFIIAQNLEMLYLNTSRTLLSMISTSSLIPDSLKTLTGLYITDVAQVTDLSFLCHACNLTTLEFCIYDTYEPEPPVLKWPSSIHLPSLKELIFAFIGTRYTEVLRSLHLPCIEKLSINVRMGPPLSQVVQLLTKGETPPLRSLSLGNLNEVIDPDSALQCFMRFKEIEQLTFHLFPSRYWQETSTQPLLERLEGNDSDSDFKLFPQLSSITIRNTSFLTVDYETLREILWNRSTLHGGKLTCAKFVNCVFTSPGDKEALQALTSELDGQLKIDIVVDEEFPF